MKEILIRVKFDPDTTMQPTDEELHSLKLNLIASLQSKLNWTKWRTEVD